ncbi:MAG: methyltransferase [Candidatus Hodarchaeales archaeon]
MSKIDKNSPSFSLLFEKQHYHLLAIISLTIILFFLFSLPDFTKGSLLGITTQTWIFIAFVIPIMHQVYVMVVWRLELHLSLVSRKLGSLGFYLYGFLFMILFLSRFLVLFVLAISNTDTLILWDYSIHIILSLIFLLLGVYLVYSVEKYFGIKRALGIDHFDSSYSKNSLVKQGIFKYMDNSMYLVGFLLFYIPGLMFSSLAALLMAFLHHIYIWVHFYFTERPDMIRIYGYI